MSAWKENEKTETALGVTERWGKSLRAITDRPYSGQWSE